MAMVNSNLLLGLIAIAAVTTTLAGLIAVLWVTRRPRKLPDFTPPVTICKPLKGVDEGLEENLRSFFRLDYPTFQLLFCVAEADDPAIAVVNRLLAEFPDHDARLIVGCPIFGLNPKVESLAAMDRYRKHDTILISDSNVRVRPSYLRETACYLADPSVGLVSNLFAGVGEEQTGAVLENLQLNGLIASGVALAAVLRATCVVGKSMLMPVLRPGSDRGLRRGPPPAGRGPGDRPPGPQGRLRDPAEPSRHRQRQPRPRLLLVPEPPLAVVQDPQAAGAVDVPRGADDQPGDDRPGLGDVGRVGDRLGGPGRPGRPRHGARRDPDALAPRLVPQVPPPDAQPDEGPLPPSRLVRRAAESSGPVARPSISDRPLHPAPPGRVPLTVRRRVRRVRRLRTRDGDHS